MLHINRYPVWPSGRRKKLAGLGPLSGTLIEKYDARACFDPMTLTSVGAENPWGVPYLLWTSLDGEIPTIDPAGMTLAASGAGVVSGMPAPYQYPSGVDVTEERYDGVDYRRDSTHPMSWLITDDIAILLKFKACDAYSTTRGVLLSNQANANVNGWSIQTTTTTASLVWRIYLSGVSHESPVSIGTSWRRTHNLGFCILDRSTTMQYGWLNGIASTPRLDGTTDNNSLVGTGLSIGAYIGGTAPAIAGMGVEWFAIYKGADLYEFFSADSERLIKRITYESLGLRETITNSKYWLYSHPSGTPADAGAGGTSYKDHNGRWCLASFSAPAAGNPNGSVAVGYARNQATSNTNNIDPTVTTGWTVSGGVFSVVSDAAALLTAKAEVWGPNVFSFENTSGSSQTAYCGASPSVVSCHFHLLARYTVGGAGDAEIGWFDVSAGTFTAVGTISDNYDLTEFYRQTPPDSDCRFCIRVPDQCTLLFIAQSLNGYTVADTVGLNKYPVPYTALGAYMSTMGRRGSEIYATEHTPVPASGSITVNLAPLGWSGTECAVDNSLLQCVTTPGDILHAEKATAGWATSDGTTQIQTVAPSVPTDGVYVDVWTAWKAALQYVQQGLTGVAVTGAYDGNKGTVGNLAFQLPTEGSGDCALKYVEIRDVS